MSSLIPSKPNEASSEHTGAFRLCPIDIVESVLDNALTLKPFDEPICNLLSV